MTDEQALKILNRMGGLGNVQVAAALDVAAEALRERIGREAVRRADTEAPGPCRHEWRFTGMSGAAEEWTCARCGLVQYVQVR